MEEKQESIHAGFETSLGTFEKHPLFFRRVELRGYEGFVCRRATSEGVQGSVQFWIGDDAPDPKKPWLGQAFMLLVPTNTAPERIEELFEQEIVRRTAFCERAMDKLGIRRKDGAEPA